MVLYPGLAVDGGGTGRKHRKPWLKARCVNWTIR